MNYVLVYKNEKNEIMAALPDIEGVYKKQVKLKNFNKSIRFEEIIVGEMNNFAYASQLSEEDSLTFKVVYKFSGPTKIYESIKSIGFEKFLTSVIKKYIQSPDFLKGK